MVSLPCKNGSFRKMGALPYKINRSYKRWEPYHIKQIGAIKGGNPTTQNKVKPCFCTAFYFDCSIYVSAIFITAIILFVIFLGNYLISLSWYQVLLLSFVLKSKLTAFLVIAVVYLPYFLRNRSSSDMMFSL